MRRPAYTGWVPFDVGPWELVILLGVLVLLFGAKGLPDAAKRLGSGVREIRNAVGEIDPRGMLDLDDSGGERRAPHDETDA